MIHISSSCSCSSIAGVRWRKQETGQSRLHKTHPTTAIITIVRHFSRSQGARSQHQSIRRTGRQTDNWHEQTNRRTDGSISPCYCDVRHILSWNRHELNELSRVESAPMSFCSISVRSSSSSGNISAINQTGNEARNVEERLGEATWRHAGSCSASSGAAVANCRHHCVRLAITWTRRIIDSRHCRTVALVGTCTHNALLCYTSVHFVHPLWGEPSLLSLAIPPWVKKEAGFV